MNVDRKRTFHLRKDTVLGLDIGSSAVKMVVVNKSKTGYTVADAAIVRTAQYSDSNTAVYMADIFKKRRDIIGRYYYGKISPLEEFTVKQTSSERYRLEFMDLAVKQGFAPSAERRYRYWFPNKESGKHIIREQFVDLNDSMVSSTAGNTFRIFICAPRIGFRGWCRPVQVYLQRDISNDKMAVIGCIR